MSVSIDYDKANARTQSPTAIAAAAIFGAGKTFVSPSGDTTGVIDTAAIQAVLDAGKVAVLGVGQYYGWAYVRANNAGIDGAGSALTSIKLPDGATHTQPNEAGNGTVSGVPTVVDCGHLSRGNNATAYSGITVRGVTLDGNEDGTSAPATDVFGWGLTFTKITCHRFSDVRVIKCHAGGIGVFIDSNDGIGDGKVEFCGTGYTAPGFDINSSKRGQYVIESTSCVEGARLLDNCRQNHVELIIKDATTHGLILTNQTANASYGNTIDAHVSGGCSTAGVSIGDNFFANNLRLTVEGITGHGVIEQPTNAPYSSKGNDISVATKACQKASVLSYGDGNRWSIRSYRDGLEGGAGSYFAVDINGDANVLDVWVDGHEMARGLAFRSGADSNKVAALSLVSCVSGVSDSGSGNEIPGSGWTNVTFGSGWGNTFGAPYAPVSYSKDGGRVILRGTATGGSGTVFTLPAGYRPSAHMQFGTTSNGAHAVVRIESGGDVILVSGSATSLSLSGIAFPAY